MHLGKKLSFKPVGRKINGNNTCNVPGRVKYRAVGAVELAPLVRIRNIVDRGNAVSRTGKRFCKFNAVTECGRTYLVKVHRENKTVFTFFPDTVNIFEFNVIPEDRKLVIQCIVFIASDIFFLHACEIVAVNRCSGTVC